MIFPGSGVEDYSTPLIISVGPVIPGGLHFCIARFRFTGR
jgi:hypothetical protein